MIFFEIRLQFAVNWLIRSVIIWVYSETRRRNIQARNDSNFIGCVGEKFRAKIGPCYSKYRALVMITTNKGA